MQTLISLDWGEKTNVTTRVAGLFWHHQLKEPMQVQGTPEAQAWTGKQTWVHEETQVLTVKVALEYDGKANQRDWHVEAKKPTYLQFTCNIDCVQSSKTFIHLWTPLVKIYLMYNTVTSVLPFNNPIYKVNINNPDLSTAMLQTDYFLTGNAPKAIIFRFPLDSSNPETLDFYYNMYIMASLVQGLIYKPLKRTSNKVDIDLTECAWLWAAESDEEDGHDPWIKL